MVIQISTAPNQIKTNCRFSYQDERLPQYKNFPVYHDRYTYVVDCNVRTGVGEPTSSATALAVHIGAFCSISRYITMEINEDHDYLNPTMCTCDMLGLPHTPLKIREKGSILIQNDVWIGQTVTIYGGVTIHNGAVVAGNSVVTKDVPPYAIVGGNPARVIKYRFDQETIDKLLKIQWWYWDEQLLKQRKKWFHANVQDFVSRFYPESLEEKLKSLQIPQYDLTYLFFPDFDEPFAIWKKVIMEYCKFYQKQQSKTVGIILFVNKNENPEQKFRQIEALVKDIDSFGEIFIYCGDHDDEKAIFQYVDFFITSRGLNTIQRTCFADLHQVPILSGVDVPILFSDIS